MKPGMIVKCIDDSPSKTNGNPVKLKVGKLFLVKEVYMKDDFQNYGKRYWEYDAIRVSEIQLSKDYCRLRGTYPACRFVEVDRKDLTTVRDAV